MGLQGLPEGGQPQENAGENGDMEMGAITPGPIIAQDHSPNIAETNMDQVAAQNPNGNSITPIPRLIFRVDSTENLNNRDTQNNSPTQTL